MINFSTKVEKIENVSSEALVLFALKGEKGLLGSGVGVDEKIGDLIKTELKEENFEGKEGEAISFHTHGKLKSKHLICLGLGKKDDITPYSLRKSFAALSRKLKDLKSESAALDMVFFKDLPLSLVDVSEAVVEGMELGAYEFKKYKGEDEKKKTREIKEVLLVTPKSKEMLKLVEGVKLGVIFSTATSYARDLVNEPSAITTPTFLSGEANKLAKDGSIRSRIYSKDEITKMGMEAFLGVSKGSDEPPKMIKLEYSPSGAKKHVLVVGKGITFDTGGLSLKPDEHMETMKMDMAGAAAILGIFKALIELKPKIKVTGLIAACENMPSGHAIKPGDIVKAYNGKTIEVLNTDAEGRLTLADVLSYGETLKPDVIIDLATLTGACMVALGIDIAGLFSTNTELSGAIKKASKAVGEKVWELPLEEDYKKLIESPVADLSNVGQDKYGGALTAALFLKEFVKNTPWAHLDIAGPAFWEKNGPYGGKGGSGFGVRLILKYLLS